MRKKDRWEREREREERERWVIKIMWHVWNEEKILATETIRKTDEDRDNEMIIILTTFESNAPLGYVCLQFKKKSEYYS